MKKRFAFALPVALSLMLTGCGLIDPKPVHFETSKAQAGPFEGQVTALHNDAHSVDTENKTGEGTVYFSAEVRPVSDFQKLRAGDRVKGRIVVEAGQVYITDVRITQ